MLRTKKSQRQIRKTFRLPWKTPSKQRADFLLLFLTFILTIFGLIMVYDASIVEANENFGDQFYYLKFQGAYFLLGWISLLIIAHVDYHRYRRFITPLFGFGILLLSAVLIPGIGLQLKGARRWIDLGPVTLQPSELFKTIFVLYLANWLNPQRTPFQFFSLVGLVGGLVMLEPDMGTTIVLMGSAFVVYFVLGTSIKQMIMPALIGLGLGLVLILSSPYRRERLTTFLEPDTDLLGTSYHLQQILLSLGSGGWIGLGLGQSKQKYQYLPEANTDSIFAIVGEETGFLGTTLLISLFSVVIWKGFRIAQHAPDVYGRLLAAGITSWIGLQVFVNVASMVSLTPLTGIPLPLLSYGGTSLVVTLASIGILLNVSKQTIGIKG